MDLGKDRICTGSEGRRGEHSHGSPISTRLMACGSRFLIGMRGVKANRPKASHGFKPAKVHHEVSVAKGCASFSQEHTRRSCTHEFLHHILHVFRSEKLALFYVDGLARLACGDQQVGLTAQEGGDLQQVGDFRYGSGLIRVMYIGGYTYFQRVFYLLKDLQSFSESRSPKRANTCSVCLIEARLENQRDLRLATVLLKRSGKG